METVPPTTSKTWSLIDSRTYQIHEIANQYRMPVEKLTELRDTWKQWLKETSAQK